MKLIIQLHEAVTLSTLLYNAETWPLDCAAKKEIDKMELWAWKSMIGLPKTTPTAAVMFATGALFPSIRIEMKQLIFLHQILQKSKRSIRQKLAYTGWACQIDKILRVRELELDWDVIKMKTQRVEERGRTSC